MSRDMPPSTWDDAQRLSPNERGRVLDAYHHARATGNRADLMHAAGILFDALTAPHNSALTLNTQPATLMTDQNNHTTTQGADMTAHTQYPALTPTEERRLAACSADAAAWFLDNYGNLYAGIDAALDAAIENAADEQIEGAVLDYTDGAFVEVQTANTLRRVLAATVTRALDSIVNGTKPSTQTEGSN